MQTLLDSCNRFVGAAYGIQEARIHALRLYRVWIELNGYLKFFFRAGKIPNRLSASDQAIARARAFLGRNKTSVADMNNGTPAMARPT